MLGQSSHLFVGYISQNMTCKPSIPLILVKSKKEICNFLIFSFPGNPFRSFARTTYICTVLFCLYSVSQVGISSSFNTASSFCHHAAWCSAPQALSSGMQLMMFFLHSRMEYTSSHWPYFAFSTIWLISFASSSILQLTMAIVQKSGSNESVTENWSS